MEKKKRLKSILITGVILPIISVFILMLIALNYFLKPILNTDSSTLDVVSISSASLNAKIEGLIDKFVSSAIEFRSVFIFIMVISIIGITLLLVSVANRLVNRIKFLEKSISNLEKGDFTPIVNPIESKRSDEINEVYNSIGKTKEGLKDIIGSIKILTDKVNDKSKYLNDASEEMLNSVSSISEAMNAASTGNADQNEQILEIVNLFNRFGNKVKYINNNVSNIYNTSIEIGESAKVSNKDMERLIASMNKFNNNFEVFVSSIEVMEDKIKSVNEITEVINNISEQDRKSVV